MTLQDLGNIGEFVAAVAVFVSLLYLAIQIRQNTKSVRTSTYQAVLDSSHRVNELFADPRTERIYRVVNGTHANTPLAREKKKSAWK